MNQVEKQTWNKLFQSPAFWHDYYSNCIEPTEAELDNFMLGFDQSLQRMFGPSFLDGAPIPSGFESLYKQPNMILELLFASGCSLDLEFYPAPGIKYTLRTPEFGSTFLGTHGKENSCLVVFHPIEVQQLYRSIERQFAGRCDANWVPLLLVPLTACDSQSKDTEDYRKWILELWRQVRVLSEVQVEEVVNRIIWGQIEWRSDAEYGWLNSAKYSIRNPSSKFWNESEARHIAQFVSCARA